MNSTESDTGFQMKFLKMIKCPISYKIIKDPVMLIPSGKIYDRKSIENWLKRNQTDPILNTRLQFTQLIPIKLLSDIIMLFEKSVPEHIMNSLNNDVSLDDRIRSIELNNTSKEGMTNETIDQFLKKMDEIKENIKNENYKDEENKYKLKIDKLEKEIYELKKKMSNCNCSNKNSDCNNIGQFSNSMKLTMNNLCKLKNEESQIEVAKILMKRFNYKGALEYIDRSLYNNPNDVDAYICKSKCYLNLFKYKEAQSNCKLAKDLEEYEKNNMFAQEIIKLESDIQRLSELYTILNSKNLDVCTKELTKLDLSNMKIGDDGINIITSCCTNFIKLNYLNLSNNNITDEGINNFSKCDFLSNLTEINFDNNYITDIGVSFFINCGFLKKLTFISLLNCIANRITTYNFFNNNKSFFPSLSSVNI